MKKTAHFRLRLYRDEVIAIGPGKVQLLEAIQAQGSISAAARALDMSYRRAWNLVDEMNQALVQPVVASSSGGHGGGGAQLTATGHAVITHYRAVEAMAQNAAAQELQALQDLLK